MRLHRNLCFAVIDGLHLIFNEGEYADKVIQQLLKRDKRWGSRDRGFVAETVYSIVRYQRLYAEIANVKAPYHRDDLWRIFAVWATLKGIKLPDWIDELGVKELGEAEWTKEIAKQNEQADVILRVNTLKTTKKDLQLKLQSEDIDTEFLPNHPSALKLVERANVFKTEGKTRHESCRCMCRCWW